MVFPRPSPRYGALFFVLSCPATCRGHRGRPRSSHPTPTSHWPPHGLHARPPALESKPERHSPWWGLVRSMGDLSAVCWSNKNGIWLLKEDLLGFRPPRVKHETCFDIPWRVSTVSTKKSERRIQHHLASVSRIHQAPCLDLTETSSSSLKIPSLINSPSLVVNLSDFLHINLYQFNCTLY